MIEIALILCWLAGIALGAFLVQWLKVIPYSRQIVKLHKEIRELRILLRVTMRDDC